MPRRLRQPAPLPRRNPFRAMRNDPRAICNVSNHGKSISAAITREYIVPPYSSALVVFHSRNSTRRHKNDRMPTHEEQVGWRSPRTTGQHLLIVPLQLFRPKLGACLPVQETSIARRGPRAGRTHFAGTRRTSPGTSSRSGSPSRDLGQGVPRGEASSIGEASWNGTTWLSSTATMLRSWTGRRRPHAVPGNLCTGSQRA